MLRRDGATLAAVGRVSGLGQGQRIYSVRFIGDVGYVVTFRQVDPLYTIDLSDPTAPKVLGELELLGYSAYLHPIADDLLLGVGQDATPEGRTKGVAGLALRRRRPGPPEAARPARARRGLLVAGRVRQPRLPLLGAAPARRAARRGLRRRAPAGRRPASSARSRSRSTASGIAEAGRIAHEPAGGYVPPINRSIVIGDQLLTVSDGGVMASALDGFGRTGWVAFPGPAGATSDAVVSPARQP